MIQERGVLLLVYTQVGLFRGWKVVYSRQNRINTMFQGRNRETSCTVVCVGASSRCTQGIGGGSVECIRICGKALIPFRGAADGAVGTNTSSPMRFFCDPRWNSRGRCWEVMSEVGRHGLVVVVSVLLRYYCCSKLWISLQLYRPSLTSALFVD